MNDEIEIEIESAALKAVATALYKHAIQEPITHSPYYTHMASIAIKAYKEWENTQKDKQDDTKTIR